MSEIQEAANVPPALTSLLSSDFLHGAKEAQCKLDIFLSRL